MSICWECVWTLEIIFTLVLFGFFSAILAGLAAVVTIISQTSNEKTLAISIGTGSLIWLVFSMAYLSNHSSYSALYYKTNEVLQIIAHLSDDLAECVIDSLPALDKNKNTDLVKKSDFNSFLEACEIKQ